MDWFAPEAKDTLSSVGKLDLFRDLILGKTRAVFDYPVYVIHPDFFLIRHDVPEVFVLVLMRRASPLPRGHCDPRILSHDAPRILD